MPESAAVVGHLLPMETQRIWRTRRQEVSYFHLKKWVYAAERGARVRSLAVAGACQVTPACRSRRSR
jgi:hypothetical protein